MSTKPTQDPLARRLLDAAAADGPTPESRRRAALALGLPVSPLPSLGEGGAPSPASPPTSPGAAPAPVGGSTALGGGAAGTSGAAGAVAVGGTTAAVKFTVVAAMIAVGGAAWWQPWEAPAPTPAPDRVEAHAPMTPMTLSPADPPKVGPEPPPAAAAAEPTPADEVLSPPPLAPRPSATRSPTPRPGGLAAETAILSEAHHAWQAGDAAGLATALDRYRHCCEGGALSREAALLAIDHLRLIGDEPGARAEAQAFEARHGSPLPERLRGLAEGAPGGGTEEARGAPTSEPP